MALSLVGRMTRAYGDPISFIGSPYIPTNSEYFGRYDGSAVVMTNNGVTFPEETVEQMQAFMIGHLMADREGYAAKVYTECTIHKDNVLLERSRLASFPIRDEALIVDPVNIRKIMVESAAFLKRVAVNNIMAADHGVNVTEEYYYLGESGLVRDLSLKVDRNLASLGRYNGLGSVPMYIKYNIGMPTLFLAENYLYGDDASRQTLDKFLLTGAFVNDLIRALGLDIPRRKLLGPGFRENHYTVARYQNALDFLYRHMGAYTLFHPRLAPQSSCDTQWLNDARAAIELFENPLETSSIEGLLEHLDNLLKVQMLDADKEIEKIYSCVLDRVEKPGTLTQPEIKAIIVDICVTKQLPFAATFFEERLSR